MASPFHVFRRYQKGLLIVAGVILILVFVLDDSLRVLMGGNPSSGAYSPVIHGQKVSSNGVAVHWKGGKLTNAELEQLVFRRSVTNSFQRQVHDIGAQEEQRNMLLTGASPRQLTVQPVVGPDRLEEGVERDVVRTKIFADAAREIGMIVSDEEIRRYLFELGRGRVSAADMQALIRRSQSSGHISAEYIFNSLRDELLARYYLNSYAFATSSVMPEQQWEDWRRVNDRISVEAAGLTTDSFLVDVKEPSAAELTAFYDKFKDFERRPEVEGSVELPSPNPGFRVPRKIEVQYLVAQYSSFLDKAKSEITDEEVQAYYDKNKDPYYIKVDTTIFDKPAEQKPAGEADASAKQDEAKPPAATEGAAKAGSDAKSGENKQAPPAAGSEKSTGKSAATEPRSNVFRTVAFEQQAGGATGAATPPAAAQQTAPPSTTSATAPPAQPVVGAAADQAAEAAKKPVEYLPLDDKLKNEIRTQLATPKVNDRLNQLVTKVQEELNSEFRKYYRTKIDAEERKQAPPAAPAGLTDLTSLAAANGLEFHKLGPLSQIELRDDKAIGQITDTERSGYPLFYTFFSKDVDLYKPLVTSDVDNNRYILLKTADVPGRVPPLDEIREEVVKAWKFDKASEAALKQAEADAKKAQEAGTPLKEFFASNMAVKVVQTDPFAWLTGGEVSSVGGQFRQNPYRMSEPDDIVAADQAFMKTVFNLEDGKVAAVLNHDHSIAYVVRVADHQYGPEKLREMYLAEANSWLGQSAMNNGRAQAANSALQATILKNAGYEEDRSLAPRDSNEQ